MSKRIFFLLIPLLTTLVSLSGQQTVSFTYWNDDSWTGSLEVLYWVEMNGERKPLNSFKNGITPTEIDQDLKLIVEFKDLQLGFKKGKKRGKDHSKYFFLECSQSASFFNSESSGLTPLFERSFRLQEDDQSIYLPFKVFPNVSDEKRLILKTGFVVRHKEYPEMAWPTKMEKSFVIQPNSSLLDQELRSEEAKSIYNSLTSSNLPMEDQAKMILCDKLLDTYSPFLSGRELQEVRSIKKMISDKLPDLSEKAMYELIRRNIKNGLSNEAVGQAKTYLMHLSATHYKGLYREDVIFTIINQSDKADEVAEFIKLYKRDYPSGRYLKQLAKAQQKVLLRSSRRGTGQIGLEGPSSSDSNFKNIQSGENGFAQEIAIDTSTADITFDPEKQSINVTISGTSNALMLSVVDRISQKGWNTILPPDKESYEVNIWTDQEFAQLSSGMYSAQLSKVLTDTSYAISDEIMIDLQRPVHIPKVIFYLGALFLMLSSYGFYQKYLKL